MNRPHARSATFNRPIGRIWNVLFKTNVAGIRICLVLFFFLCFFFALSLQLVSCACLLPSSFINFDPKN